MEIPSNIIAAVNALLAPYGESYPPAAPAAAPSRSKGFTDWRGAAKYVGCSVTAIRRAVLRGDLPAPKKIGIGRNGRIAFPLDALERWIASCPDANPTPEGK